MSIPTTWNQADKHADITLSNGDLTAVSVGANGSYRSVRSNNVLDGSYCEITVDYIEATNAYIGIANALAALDAFIGTDVNGWCYEDGGLKSNGSWLAFGNSWIATDIISIAYKNGKLWFAKNGVWQASGNPSTGANPAFDGITGDVFFAVTSYHGVANASQYTANFGAAAFTYTVPTGFNGVGIGPANLNTYLGVSKANIAKINDTLIANVAKLNNVA